jgi:PQQ-dependent catabolism-associated CXXCW motif protein
VNRRVLIFAMVVAISWFSLAAVGQNVPDGYRMSDYRAPTPAVVPGATTVTTEELDRFIEADYPILIDVLPSPPKPADLPSETVWLPRPHVSIAGAVWLPNVGYGALSDDMDRYFRSSLDRLTAGRRDRHLVFFCEPDCWMSWNASRRALEYGYSAVYFYPEGVQGWQDANLPTAAVKPFGEDR